MAASIEQVKAGIWTVGEWIERFEKEHWGSIDPDEHLVKLADRLFEGNDNKKVYFPCCGNSSDMKWAYELGYEIVGTDCIKDSIIDFFTSKIKMNYQEEAIDSINGTLYKTEDGKIRLYCCDVLNFSRDLESPCGAMVDSAAITSINIVDLPRYVQHLISMMSQNCRLILYATEYDETVYPGPPHNLPQKKIEELFGPTCSFERLKTIEMMEMTQEVMKDVEQESDKNPDSQGQHGVCAQDDKSKSEREMKDEVFNQISNLKSLKGHYILITRRQE